MDFSNVGSDLGLGTVIPLLVGFLTKCSWPGWIKSGLVLVFSIVAATVRLDVTGGLNWQDFAGSFFTIVAAAGVTYQTVTASLAKKLQEVGPVK